ncbi:MAG: transcriptional repressor [Bdellovibrionales bacterium]|nr:transcriptional repressor [Bdellovibrionales bacterium]
MSEVILAEGLQNPEEQVLKRENLTEKDFKKIIRQMGLKVTQQRLVILETLAEGRVHVTAQEVFEIVNDKFPEMGFATVYRFLRKLTENNFVTEVRMGGLPARYELTPKRHHDHLTCVQCGKIVEFENQEIEKLQEQVAKKFGFELTNHVLELYGKCRDCQLNSKRKEA